MTDKELIEAAANIAGIKLVYDPTGIPRNCTGFDPAMNIYAAQAWNPLEDNLTCFSLGLQANKTFIVDISDGMRSVRRSIVEHVVKGKP